MAVLCFEKSKNIKNTLKHGMLVHTYKPSTWEAEAGELQVQGQPGLHRETLSQKNQKPN
jgi:hypothetical protein